MRPRPRLHEEPELELRVGLGLGDGTAPAISRTATSTSRRLSERHGAAEGGCVRACGPPGSRDRSQWTATGASCHNVHAACQFRASLIHRRRRCRGAISGCRVAFRPRYPADLASPQASPVVVAALDAAGWGRIDDSHLFVELGSMTPRSPARSLLGQVSARLYRRQAAKPAPSSRPVDGLVAASCSRMKGHRWLALIAIGDGGSSGQCLTNTTQRKGQRRHDADRPRLGQSAGATIAALNVADNHRTGLYRGLGQRLYDYISSQIAA